MTSSHLRDVWVKGGHHLVHRLNHRHFATKRGVNISEFKTDVTTADDGDPTGQPLQVDRFIAGEHRASIGFDTRGHKWIGTCGEDDVLGRDHPINTAGLTQADALRTLKTTMAPEDRHASPFQSFGEVCSNGLHQLIGVISDLLPLETHRRRMNPEAGQMLVIRQLTHFAAGRQQSF